MNALETFKQFLIDKECLESYTHYLEVSDYSLKHEYNHAYRFIIDAFDWKLTKEGDFFWSIKDDEWKISPETIDVSYDLSKTVENAYDINRKGNIIENVFKSLKSMLGGKIQINVAIDFNEDKLTKELEKISKDINVEVKNATLDIENDMIKIIKEVVIEMPI